MNSVTHLLFILLCLLVSAGAGVAAWVLFTYPFHLPNLSLPLKLTLLIAGVLCGLLAALPVPYAVGHFYSTVLEPVFQVREAENEPQVLWWIISGTLLLCAGIGNGVQRLLWALFQSIGRVAA